MNHVNIQKKFILAEKMPMLPPEWQLDKEVKWKRIIPIAPAGPKIIIGIHFPSPPHILYIPHLRPVPQLAWVACVPSGVT